MTRPVCRWPQILTHWGQAAPQKSGDCLCSSSFSPHPQASSFCHIRELIHSLLDPGLPQVHPGPIMQRRENTARVSSKYKMQETTTMLDIGSSRGPVSWVLKKGRHLPAGHKEKGTAHISRPCGMGAQASASSGPDWTLFPEPSLAETLHRGSEAPRLRGSEIPAPQGKPDKAGPGTDRGSSQCRLKPKLCLLTSASLPHHAQAY